MKVLIDRRLTLEERSSTVLMRGAEIWTYGDKTRTLQRHKGVLERKLTSAAPLPSISVEDGVLAWDGTHLLVADRANRKVFRVDPAGGRETLLMDPKSLVFGDYGRALLVSDAVIGDIAWHAGLLYLAVQAGYSSAIYGIDPGKNHVVSCRPAPGPKPSGLEFDPVDSSMYTIDNRNRELRRFTQAETMDVAELPQELADPRGLSFDQERGLWCADWSSGDVLKIRVEG